MTCIDNRALGLGLHIIIFSTLQMASVSELLFHEYGLSGGYRKNQVLS